MKEVRKNEELKDTTFILITGNLSQKMIEEALALKVNQILVKPFSVADLVGKIREVCKGLKPKTPSTGKPKKPKAGAVSDISWDKV